MADKSSGMSINTDEGRSSPNQSAGTEMSGKSAKRLGWQPCGTNDTKAVAPWAVTVQETSTTSKRVSSESCWKKCAIGKSRKAPAAVTREGQGAKEIMCPFSKIWSYGLMA